MSLSVKWLLIWFVSLILLLAAIYYPNDKKVIVPEDINTIEIPSKHIKLKHSPNGQWLADGADINESQQILINRWVADMQTECIDNGYRIDDIQPATSDQPILLFRLNGLDYRFAALNTYSVRHYLYHEQNAYLCNATLKPRLEHAHHLWMTPHA